MFCALIPSEMFGGKKLNTTVTRVYTAANILIGSPNRPSVQGPKCILPPRSRRSIMRQIGIM